MSDWTRTTCMRCAVGCGLRQRTVDDERPVTSAHGDPGHPTNQGGDCQRGIRETVNPRGERLTEPLVRRGGRLQPTDWDTALGVVASRLIEALRADAGNVAVLGSGQQTNEAVYALGKVARGGFGTPHYDANTGLCMASAITAYDHAFGGNAPPPTYEDIPDAETHVVWGANPAVAHPVLYDWIVDSASDERGQLLVVDPIESETARDADLHVRPEPGTDLALVRAILARLVETDAIDREFVDENTQGFGELVLPDVETAAATVDVPTEQIDALAAAFGDPTLVYWGMGVNQSVQGTATARALIDLCLATGNLGPGSGPFSLTGQANSMGNRICASKETWPGHQEFDDTEVRKRVAATWDVPFSRLPDGRGTGFVRIADRIARGETDVCWTVATNPAAGMPDAGYIEDVLSDVFLVVQDSFRSATVECADVVLPAATWGETAGSTINMERRVSRIRPAVDPPGDVRQDLDIIAAVGNRIEEGLFATPPLDPAAVFDELRSLTTGAHSDLSGITYDRLDEELAVRWPAPDTTSQGGYLYHSPDAWSFDTDSGLAEFSTATNSRVPEPTDDAYPLTLTTGRCSDRYNTGVRSHRREDTTLPVARMNPETVAGALQSFDRGRTVVESRRGSVTVEVETDEAVPAEMVWLPIHDPAINELTLPVTDPESDEPNFKQCAVALRAPEDN